MLTADPLATRLAAAQLAGLSRARRVVGDDALEQLRDARRVVAAPPFTALLAVDGPEFLSYAVAADPGSPVTDLGDSLSVLRAAFAPGHVRFELIEQACPGAVAQLTSAGVRLTARIPVLAVQARAVRPVPVPDGVTVELVATASAHRSAVAVAEAAFGVSTGSAGDPPDPVDGGSVLASMGGVAVSVASWTQVADGITEIVGVATLPEHRGLGLGALVTAAAVRTAAESAGVTLAWLTPGDPSADRVYRRVGFTPVATAAHLADQPD